MGAPVELDHLTDWRRLGGGGAREVWAAREALTGRAVVVRLSQATDRGLRHMLRERDLVSRIHHPRLQRLIEARACGERLALIYAFVEGEPLVRRLERGPLPVSGCIRIARDLLDAVEALHAAGLAHRDVTPENVILTPEGGAVLIDFDAVGALTEQLGGGDMATTVVGEFAGKLAYAAPEQLFRAQQGAPADIWGVGATVYEAASGKQLREGAETLADVMRAAFARHDLADAPAALRPFLEASLEPDAMARASAAQARALLDVAQGQPMAAAPPGATRREMGAHEADWALEKPSGTATRPRAAPSPSVALPGPPPGAAPVQPGRGRAWLALLFCGAAAAGAAGALWLSQGGPLLQAGSAPDSGTSHTSGGSGAGGFLADLSRESLAALALIAAGGALVGLGQFAAGRVRSRAASVRGALPLRALETIDAPDARARLSRTICVLIDDYREAARGVADDMLRITMVALAKEYADAESSDARFRALAMLGELHEKVSARITPWWLDYERAIARAAGLVGLLGGAVAAAEGVRRLL